MLLKSLSLAGFKSFADRTRLGFHSGVNVVVGPNGSGKSNLLDAMAWVMGTQATSALRTEKMDDVIFAGTATRPRLSRAEVTLTFDNADRFIPIDIEEISMTRRLYRDGTSEYLLNGAQCRLLDLHEILADGGVGRHQHVLVGQGQIGDILNARPDEHRAVIEEAAGVMKHRGRRDRSVRRLEQTDLDIARLGDLLEDQRRRLRPLKRQANAAERYESVRDGVLALRLWIGGDTLRGLDERKFAAGEQKVAIDGQLEADGSDHGHVVQSLDGLRAAAGNVGRDLERDTSAAARLETLTERLRSIASIARERRRSLEDRIAGAGERRKDLEDERQDLAAEISGLETDQESARTRFHLLESAHEALEEEERALTEQVGLSADGLVANLRGDLRALETAAERDEREAAALQIRRKIVDGKLDSDADERAALVTSIEQADALAGTAQPDYEAARSARSTTQTDWEQAEQRQRETLLELERARARFEAIASALAGEGDPEARIKAATAGGVVGSVVELLDVPSDVAAAVDAALGQWNKAFATSDSSDAIDIAAILKADGLGGVALVTAGGEPALVSARTVASDRGVDALIDRLGPRAHRGLAARLLGDVVLVEGWANGWDLVQRFPEIRVVTPEGDVITTHRIYLAQADGVGPAALEAAGVAVENAEREAARSDSVAVTAQRAFGSARDLERSNLEGLESIEARLAGHTEALSLIDRAHAGHEAEMLRLEGRSEALEADRSARSERITMLQDRLGELEGEDELRQRAWEALNVRREEITRRRVETRRKRDEAAAALVREDERHKLLSNRLEATGAELETVASTPVNPGDLDRLDGIEARARTGVELSRGHLEALRDRQRILRERAGEADGELAAALDRRSTLELRITAAREQMASVTIELAEVEIRTEATSEALRRDADASEEQALSAVRPDIAEGETHAEALATLEARLRRMGPINLLAAEEYSELAADVDVLEAQIADLAETGRELRKVISALDEKMAALFGDAFADIARMFEQNFELVFPGGRGRLVLTDPTNPLDTGVEIYAQPLGKKVGRLSLLSGGERSLAALAFLFAVFRARPSPFYVLDEVEAALDAANLRRFLRLVDTLRRSAQLVIITHQQQTMEAADILYGVTMEPGASSVVVAKRLVDAPA